MKYKGVIFDLDGTVLNTLLDLADSVNYALEQYGLQPIETESYRYMIGHGFANLIETSISASIRKMQTSETAETVLARMEEKKPVLTDVAGIGEHPAPEEPVSLEETLVPEHTPDLMPEEDVLPSGRMTEAERAALQRGVLEAFTEEYSRRYLRSTAPDPGIHAMLTHLADAGVRIAVNSNKRDDYTKNLISRNFPDLEWTCVLGGKEDIPKKPDPAGALLIAGKMNFRPKTVKVQEKTRTCGAAANPFETEEPKKGFFAGLFSRRKESEDGEKRLMFTEMAYVGDSDVDIQTARNAGMAAIGVAWGFRGRQELEDSGADFIAEDPLQLEEYLLSE